MSAAALKKSSFAAIAEFSSAATLYEAAEKVRDAGFKFWDVHSPFPIHGMNKAMGLNKSSLGYYILRRVARISNCGSARVHSFFVSLPIDRAREAGGLLYGSGVFPDDVRAHHLILGVHCVFRCFYYESVAAA